MKLPRRKFLHLAAGAAALPAISRIASAQAYPVRPVRIIVPYATGGTTDTIARLLAPKLSEHLGKQFFVENVPGASGNVGMGRAAHAAADGYTLMAIDATLFVVNPSIFSKVPYDPFKDFDAISLPVATTTVLLVHPSLPVRSVNDLVALIEANPGKYSYASSGVGSPSHLTAELFRVALRLDLVHVPFNGAGPAITSTLGGHTPIAFGPPASSASQIKQGGLRALAVAIRTRLAALPDVPTMAESGFPDIECNSRQGIVAPAGTPRDIIALLNREIGSSVELPDVKERLAAFGFEPFALRKSQPAY
jgi:tripartite-type tricarboxylate transporter receptor subunit TctC